MAGTAFAVSSTIGQKGASKHTPLAPQFSAR